MKRETIISFALTALLAAVSGIYGLLWHMNEREAANGERIARIEAKVESLEARNRIALLP